MKHYWKMQKKIPAEKKSSMKETYNPEKVWEERALLERSVRVGMVSVINEKRVTEKMKPDEKWQVRILKLALRNMKDIMC